MGFLEKICVSGVLLQGWSSREGRCGAQAVLQSSSGAVPVMSKAPCLGQSSPGLTGMAEVGQNYPEEGADVGRRSWWR